MFSDQSDVWSENAALFKKLMEIHSNPPILYYGFNIILIQFTFSFHPTLLDTRALMLYIPLRQLYGFTNAIKPLEFAFKKRSVRAFVAFICTQNYAL